MKREDEFLSVLESHKRILYKVANSYCKRAEDREDLVQEIIYQLWKSFDKYDSNFKYSTWIYRISLNVAISFYRKQRNAPVPGLTAEASLLNIRHISFDEDKEHRLNLLQQFIQEMKELDKGLMLLYLEDKSHREMADILGISESNVGTKINRIKKILADKFSKTK